jgi:hypothetical protein
LKSIGQNKQFIGGLIEYKILRRIGQNELLIGEPIRKTHVLKSFGQNELLIAEPIEHKILKNDWLKMNCLWVNRLNMRS